MNFDSLGIPRAQNHPVYPVELELFEDMEISMNKKVIIVCASILLMALLSFWWSPADLGYAQSNEITWSNPFNISNSLNSASGDPYLVADPAGFVHLFWAEKMGSTPSDNSDTLMYAKWDGAKWTNPIDIFFSPLSDGNVILNYPLAVLDEQGWIHLIWLSQPNFPNYALNYSSAPSWEADSPLSWEPKIVLEDDLSGTKNSIHIAYRSPGELHIIYSRVPQGDNPKEERAASYIYSKDYGETWSDSVDIFTVADLQNGTSDTRILLEDPNKIFVSWTLWDITGNGQAIYFTRSLDNGQT